MKFSTIILSTFLAALSVSAQNSTATTTSSVVSGTAPLTPAQSTEAACLEACPVGDNNCRTQCIPKGDQTNAIANCITTCPKGNGTATDNANYQSCVESCISNAAASAAASPTASSSAPSGTGSGSGASTGAGSGSSATATGASGGSSSTASSTAATTSKSSAAEAVQLGSSLIGAAGLLAALFAL